MKVAGHIIGAFALLTASAQAADLRSATSVEAAAPEIADVPGGDIFGFTSGTDVGKVGDRGVALENSGDYGIRQGRYRGLSQKLEFSGTFVENWAFAASLFGAWTSIRNNPDFPDRTAYGFDGMSFEIRHRVVERSATNPFAVTLAIEPRWSRIDGLSGLRSDSYGAELKFQVDAPVGDRLYWAANANFGFGTSRDPIALNWANASDTAISTALTYEALKDKLFGRLGGQALYLGPTIAWQAKENVMINAVFLPQIAGHASGASGPFDLDNGNRANYRLKIAVGF
jgi:hypothetical protein